MKLDEIKRGRKQIMTLGNLEQQIRDFINNPRKQCTLQEDNACWNMLCSCLDIIGDTELAITAYSQTQIPENQGAKYLLIYGILQILFVQQDAVQNLCEALKIGFVANPVLEQTREIRNNSIGHPTKRGKGKGKAFNFISRSTLTNGSFDLMTTYPDDRSPIFSHINIPELIKEQRSILINVLTEILKKLKKEEAEHMSMFKSDLLQDAFPKTLHYYFEKLYESINGSKPGEIGSIHLKLIAEAVETFKNKLEDRGELKANASVNYILELLDYPVGQLTSYFIQLDSSLLDKKSAYIFAFFIEKHVAELKAIAKEIDELYNSEK